jgi:diaminopimelate epimerase
MNARTLKFSKMHGLGNDFMVIDGLHQDIRLNADEIRSLADRHFGIGFDQLLLLEKSNNADVDFSYRIFNADGSEVEQCGNGARCFAQFVKLKKLSDKNPLQVETRSGVISLLTTDTGEVRVDMGTPIFEAARIPFDVAPAHATLDKQQRITLPTDMGSLQLSVLSMGNPHAVLQVENIDAIDVKAIGTCLQQHAAFPQSVNVGFMQIINNHHIRLRVFERGAGETLACGTGACAAVVAGCLSGQLNKQVKVALAGGTLGIEWSGNTSDSVFMTGPASYVYEGELLLPL